MKHFFEYFDKDSRKDVRIASGVGHVNAITTVEIVDQCNTGDDLRVGSACCTMAKISMFTPHGSFHLAPGKEIRLYDQYDDGEEKLVGTFIVESSTRPTPNTYVITAYDHMSLYDVDISSWLISYADADAPYRLGQIVYALCEGYIGTGILDNDIYYAMDMRCPFRQRTMTGRDFLAYAAEVMGCYVHCTRNGAVEFRWFEDTDLVYAPTGSHFYVSGSLNAAAYQIRGIDDVQIKYPGMFDGGYYPATVPGQNTYVVENNPLLDYPTQTELNDARERIYDNLFLAQYTPCTFKIPYAKDAPKPGDIIHVIDRNGQNLMVYVMRTHLRGWTLTVEAWGNEVRNQTASANYSAQKAVTTAKTYTEDQIANIQQVDEFGWHLDITKASLTVKDQSGKSRMTIMADDEDTLMVSFYDENQQLVGGIMGGSSLSVAAYDYNTKSVTWRRVGWRTVGGVKTLTTY